MKKETQFKALESNGAPLNYKVIEHRCRNGHLLALEIIGQSRKFISIKCHRCKHVEEKEVGSIKH